MFRWTLRSAFLVRTSSPQEFAQQGGEAEGSGALAAMILAAQVYPQVRRLETSLC